MAGPRPLSSSVLLALCLACAPVSASVETPAGDGASPGETPSPEAPAAGPRHAVFASTLELRAQPDAAAPAVVGLRAAYAVEILDEREGWWQVRTLSPEQAAALGLPADRGLGIVELVGWTPARPETELDGPVSADADATNEGEGEPVRVASEGLGFVIDAGTTLHWPDGSEAGRARDVHGFSEPADPVSLGERTLLCHPRRAGLTIGVLEGQLCVDLEDVRDADRVAQDHPQMIALDVARTFETTEPGDEGGAQTVKGALDRDQIRDVVRLHVDEVRHCYNMGLSKDPKLEGKVAIQFVITPDGSVGSAVVQTSDLGQTTVENCIAKAVKRWVFPKPRGGGNVVVTYPFNLLPG